MAPQALLRSTRPKYQVFLSSTYTDLVEERRALSWEILKSRHIPVGMENFSAANGRGWETIQRVLSQTDYYVLVVAGRYGSIDDEIGISWTEREYDYAIQHGIPVLAFTRSLSHIGGDKIDVARQRVDDFREKVRGVHHCEEWSDASDLSRRVVTALGKAIEDDEDAGTPRPAWFRGPIGDPNVAHELARLSAENEMLRSKVAGAVSSPRESLERAMADVGTGPCSVIVWPTVITDGMLAGMRSTTFQLTVDSSDLYDNHFVITSDGALNNVNFSVPYGMLEHSWVSSSGTCIEVMLRHRLAIRGGRLIWDPR